MEQFRLFCKSIYVNLFVKSPILVNIKRIGIGIVIQLFFRLKRPALPYFVLKTTLS